MNAIQSTLYGTHLSQIPSKYDARPEQRPGTLHQAIAVIETMQDELNELRSKLSHAERLSALGTLTAGLAHEYNNILTPIGSYAQLALSQPGNQTLTQKALNAAVKGSARASQLVESTLGLVSVDDENPEDRKTPEACESRQVIEEILDNLRPTLISQDIEIQTAIQAMRIGVDSLSMQQIITNLVNNAANAMRGKARDKLIKITGRQAGDLFELKVEDSGPGIPEAILKQVFEPFVSRQESLAGDHEQVGGTGLGMSICKQLIETAGGSIQAGKSQLGGACIQLDLPAAD